MYMCLFFGPLYKDKQTISQKSCFVIFFFVMYAASTTTVQQNSEDRLDALSVKVIITSKDA